MADSISRLQYLRKMRLVARAALETFGIHGRFELLRHAGNTLYRVYTSTSEPTSSFFELGQYLLRVHEPGYQSPEAIELELDWLSVMRGDADLPVPEPLAASDGRFLVEVDVPGILEPRRCSLLRWIKGRSVLKKMMPPHYHAQGRLMARLHDFSAAWSPPPSPVKRHFDWEGLFVNDVGSGMPNAEAWSLLPPKQHEAFSAVADQVRDVMETWGQSRDVYGLIHGDLALDANLLFSGDQPVAIDFDDSGFGYHIYDLAVALEHCWDHIDFHRFHDALLDGYAEVRSLPDQQVAKLELFIAACKIYWNLWAVGGTHLYPRLLPEFQARIERNANLVVGWVEDRSVF